MRVKHKLLNVIDDDNIIVTDNGSSIVIAPKLPMLPNGKFGAPDWNALSEVFATSRPFEIVPPTLIEEVIGVVTLAAVPDSKGSPFNTFLASEFLRE
jgi:hypothetical protein